MHYGCLPSEQARAKRHSPYDWDGAVPVQISISSKRSVGHPPARDGAPSAAHAKATFLACVLTHEGARDIGRRAATINASLSAGGGECDYRRVAALARKFPWDP